jgi:hypothetical protein
LHALPCVSSKSLFSTGRGTGRKVYKAPPKNEKKFYSTGRRLHLERLEEVEAGVREDDPELLPPVGRLELAQQVAGQQRS